MKKGWKILLEHYRSEEHWYIKYIVRGTVLVIFIAVLLQVFKENSFFADTVFESLALIVFKFFNDWATVLSATVTLMLVMAAFWAIMDNRHGRIVDRRERLLNEFRDWIFEIQNISLEPITVDNIVFRQTNIELKYGTAYSKVEYLKNIIVKVFKDKDFEIKLTKVEELLISVAVLDRARTSRSEVDAQSFVAFPGKKELAGRVTGEYEQKLAKLRSEDKAKDDIGMIDATNSTLWDKYVRELALSRSELLSKVTDIQASLL